MSRKSNNSVWVIDNQEVPIVTGGVVGEGGRNKENVFVCNELTDILLLQNLAVKKGNLIKELIRETNWKTSEIAWKRLANQNVKVQSILLFTKN